MGLASLKVQDMGGRCLAARSTWSWMVNSGGYNIECKEGFASSSPFLSSLFPPILSSSPLFFFLLLPQNGRGAQGGFHYAGGGKWLEPHPPHSWIRPLMVNVLFLIRGWKLTSKAAIESSTFLFCLRSNGFGLTRSTIKDVVAFELEDEELALGSPFQLLSMLQPSRWRKKL